MVPFTLLVAPTYPTISWYALDEEKAKLVRLNLSLSHLRPDDAKTDADNMSIKQMEGGANAGALMHMTLFRTGYRAANPRC